jgi:hypothetical protein
MKEDEIIKQKSISKTIQNKINNDKKIMTKSENK